MDQARAKNIRRELFKVIEVQIKDNNPSATKETFHRLRAAGYSRKETMRLLACVLLVELNDMVRDNRLYDEATYVKKLLALPERPWEKESEDCT